MLFGVFILFATIWGIFFIVGTVQTAIAASCALWYFSSSGDQQGKGSTFVGTWRVLRYHLGSLAYGSFLHCFVKPVGGILEMYRRSIARSDPDNLIVKIMRCSTFCVLDCANRFIKHLSTNAYSQVAITGKSYCQSAWNAYLLNLTKSLNYGYATSFGYTFTVFGTVVVLLLNLYGMFITLNYYPPMMNLTLRW